MLEPLSWPYKYVPASKVTYVSKTRVKKKRSCEKKKKKKKKKKGTKQHIY